MGPEGGEGRGSEQSDCYGLVYVADGLLLLSATADDNCLVM